MDESFSAPPVARYPRRAYAWGVVWILLATAVLSYTDRQILSLLVDPIRSELGISDTQISLLLGGAFAVVYGVAGIPMGFLADRISRRNLIFAGVAVWSLGTIVCGFCHTYREIFASRAIVGLGEAALAPAALSLISDYFPPSRRGSAVALFLSGIAMGSGAAILIGGGVLHVIDSGVFASTVLAALSPWRIVMLAVGFPGLLLALIILLIREPLRQGALDPGPTIGELSGAWHTTAWARVTPIFIGLVAESFADAALGAWAPTLLLREFAQNPARLGVQLGILLTAGFGGGVLLGGLLADRASRRNGWRDKVRICMTVSVLIMPVACLLTSTRFLLVMAAIPLYFVLAGINAAVGTSAILDIVPNRSMGLAMSVSFFLNVAIGAGLGPTMVSLAAAHMLKAGSSLGPPLAMTLIVGWAVCLAALATALRLFRPRIAEVSAPLPLGERDGGPHASL